MFFFQSTFYWVLYILYIQAVVTHSIQKPRYIGIYRDSNLLYRMGHSLLDRQYAVTKCICILYYIEIYTEKNENLKNK